MSEMLEDTVPSIRAQIEGLNVGESYARAARFDADATLKHVPGEAVQSMRLSVQATTHRIEKRTQQKFTIETGEFRTQSRDIIVCLVVTRTW